MLEKAVEKLRNEMSKNNNNAYIQVVGDFLLQHLKKNPEAAEQILAEDKTIIKSLDEMKKAAEKKKVGNCAVLTDQEGFEIVLKYYGMKTKKNSTISTVSTTTTADAKPEAKTRTNFDVRLEDLL